LICDEPVEDVIVCEHFIGSVKLRKEEGAETEERVRCKRSRRVRVEKLGDVGDVGAV